MEAHATAAPDVSLLSPRYVVCCADSPSEDVAKEHDQQTIRSEMGRFKEDVDVASQQPTTAAADDAIFSILVQCLGVLHARILIVGGGVCRRELLRAD